MDRRSEFKFHGLTQEELRKKREETTVQLRQTRREEALQKRRFTSNAGAGSSMMMADDMLASEPASSMTGLPSQSQLREKLAELSRTLQTSMELATLHNVAHSIRNILSREQSPPIQEAIDSGCVPRLVQLLKLVYADCPVTYDPGQLSLEEQAALKEKIVFEAAWALTNVASGKPTQTAVVVETEAPLLFSQLLDHPNPDICEQSIWALGNIAGDGPPHRDLLLVSMNLVGKVLRLLERELQSPTAHAMMIRNATWLLSNLARGKPSPSYDLLKPALPTLQKLLLTADSDTLSDAGWTLSYLTDGNNEAVLRDLRALNMLPTMVSHLGSRLTSIQAPFLRAVGNLVTGDDADTQAILECGLLHYLQALLTSATKASVQKETCWVVSNITAGTLEQVQMVIDAGIMPHMISFLRTGDLKTKKEAVWALCNATSHFDDAPHHIRYLVSVGLLKPLCEFMRRGESKEVRLLLVMLDAIDNVLKVGTSDPLYSGAMDDREYANMLEELEMVEHIDSLQRHPNEQVYLKAKAIIDKYYSGGEQADDSGIHVDDSMMQATPGASMTFDF